MDHEYVANDIETGIMSPPLEIAGRRRKVAVACSVILALIVIMDLYILT